MTGSVRDTSVGGQLARCVVVIFGRRRVSDDRPQAGWSSLARSGSAPCVLGATRIVNKLGEQEQMRINMDNNPDIHRCIRNAGFVEAPVQYDPKRAEGVEAPQDTNRDGVFLWLIHCMWVDESAAFINPETIKVKVASSARPEIPGGSSPVFFGGLVQNVNPRRNGGFSVSYSAESFTFEPAPSTKRAAAKADPPPAPLPATK